MTNKDQISSVAILWRLHLANGEVIGVTNHDQDLTVNGLNYHASRCVEPTAFQAHLGLDGDDGELAGGIDSDLITEAALVRGDYDAAKVYATRFDWVKDEIMNTSFLGWVDSVRVNEAQYVLSLVRAHPGLHRRSGRSYSPQCDARLGDGHCGIDRIGGDIFMMH